MRLRPVNMARWQRIRSHSVKAAGWEMPSRRRVSDAENPTLEFVKCRRTRKRSRKGKRL